MSSLSRKRNHSLTRVRNTWSHILNTEPNPQVFFCPVFDAFGPFHRSLGLSELSKTFLHSALLPFDLEKAPGRKPLVAGGDMTRRLHLMS